jgi:septal ring factor EnvC (AmiA/AmiB activator)
VTLLEASAAIATAIATLLGAGFGTKWLSRSVVIAKAHAKERAADVDVVGRAISFADDAREDTQRHVTELVQCERRCARLEAAGDERDRRIDRLAEMVGKQAERIATLESENIELRSRVGVLEDRIANLLPEALGNYAATIDGGGTVTPIRGRKD